MKKIINVFDYAGDICKSMKRGVLLTTKLAGKVNSMTIGWGMIGIEWGKPIFITFVRESRYTKQLLEENGEFTVNVPHGEADSKILGFCGSKSGRDVDKIKELGLTLEDPLTISVPGIREFPLTLECKILYKQKQEFGAIPSDLLERYYPQDVDSSNPGSNRDCHVAFYGEILNAYFIED